MLIKQKRRKDSFDLLSVSLTVDKREEVQISGDAEDVELEKVAS